MTHRTSRLGRLPGDSLDRGTDRVEVDADGPLRLSPALALVHLRGDVGGELHHLEHRAVGVGGRVVG
ncbi:hypothetical protein, partial [Methylobacterium sp. E-046]|uniref:hypothetical protein n=1 Tax=Methylobacterium sp. E-046 TaxID=2836576 RepID=UPI0028C3A8B3